jgi:hypothetical protein
MNARCNHVSEKPDYNRAMQLFVRQGGNLSVIEAELDRLKKQKSQLDYQMTKIDQRKDLIGIQKSFIAFTENLKNKVRSIFK